MSDRQRRVDDYLDHMLKAIDRIERYTAGMDEATFLEDELVQDGVIRNLEIIGEASRNLIQRLPEDVPEDIRLSPTAAYGADLHLVADAQAGGHLVGIGPRQQRQGRRTSYEPAGLTNGSSSA